MNNYREACRRIREKFNTKYLTAQERAEARREEVRRKIPEIAVIDKKLSSVGSEIMFVSFSYKDDRKRECTVAGSSPLLARGGRISL